MTSYNFVAMHINLHQQQADQEPTSNAVNLLYVLLGILMDFMYLKVNKLEWVIYIHRRYQSSEIF